MSIFVIYRHIKCYLKKAIADAEFYVDGEHIEIKGGDAKSKIGSLEAQNALAASQAAQTAQFQNLLNQQSAQFGALLAAYRTGRIDQRDSAAAPAA